MQRRHFLATAAASAATGMLLPGCDRAPRALEGGFTGIDMARGHQLRDLLKTGTLPAPSVVRRAQVIIAGGGVAGLAAARALTMAGIEDVALLELEQMVVPWRTSELHCDHKAKDCRRHHAAELPIGECATDGGKHLQKIEGGRSSSEKWEAKAQQPTSLQRSTK